MVATTYVSDLDLAIGSLPLVPREENPLLYQELLDIHDALEKLAQEVSSVVKPLSTGHILAEGVGINTADGFVIVGEDKTYTVPTTARLHDIVSTSVNDIGTTVSSGTADAGSTGFTLIDNSATFITDGVAPGDRILDIEAASLTFVSSVDSETQISFSRGLRDGIRGELSDPFDIGSAYKVVDPPVGSGAIIAYVRGLNLFRQEIQELVVMDGTTPSPTVQTFSRINAFRTLGSPNLGLVTATAQTDLSITAQIVLGENTAKDSVFSVPIDKKVLITHIWASIAKKQTATSNIKVKVGAVDRIGYELHHRVINSAGALSFDYPLTTPIFAVGGADIWVEADTDTNNINIAAGYNMEVYDLDADI